MGEGLVTETNHEKWKNRQALFNPGFHRQLELFLKSLDPEMGNRLKRLK